MSHWFDDVADSAPEAQAVSTGAKQPRGPSDEARVARFKQQILDEVDLRDLVGRDEADQRRRLGLFLENAISRDVRRGLFAPTNQERSDLIRRVVDEVVGLGLLEPLIADTTISEIMINGHRAVYVERDGQLESIKSSFSTDEQLRQVIDRIVSTVNRRVDESSPMVDARIPPTSRMPRGARVNVVLPPLCLNGPTMTIRLFPRVFPLAALIENDSLDTKTAQLLEQFVKARLNIVVSGGTASGKTTMLNALSSFIPSGERIITIEDAAELHLDQVHVVRLETRPSNVEGSGAVPVRELVRNALRMRPDRIIVGEVREGEALDMLQAMNTGHEGSLATVHANNPYDALARLETLASMSDVDIPFEAIRDQVNNAIDIVVQLQRASDGKRRITEVAYLGSKRRQDYSLVPLVAYTPVAHPSDPQFSHFELPEDLQERLSAGFGPA